VIPQSGESIGGLLRSVGLQATLLASITADPASHIDVLFLQVDHAVSKPKTKREIQQRPPRGIITWLRPTCDPRQSRLRLTGQPTALRLGQGRELAFAVGRNGSRRIAHRLRPDLGMLVVADYQVRQALGWEGRAALMSRAITMGGYS
jgi:hypothetical protein